MKTAIVSGYFNPLHVGHLDYLRAAARMADRLVVVVNNDEQVRIKGSVPFSNENDRLRIMRALKLVDNAVLSIDVTSNVTGTLAMLYSTLQGELVYCTGADHTAENTPAEAALCASLGMGIVYGVGGEKIESSSSLIKRFLTHKLSQ